MASLSPGPACPGVVVTIVPVAFDRLEALQSEILMVDFALVVACALLLLAALFALGSGPSR